MRRLMRTPRAGQELALIAVHRPVQMVGNRERSCFDGEHSMICVYDVGQRAFQWVGRGTDSGSAMRIGNMTLCLTDTFSAGKP